jgi:hypothetical protein
MQSLTSHGRHVVAARLDGAGFSERSGKTWCVDRHWRVRAQRATRFILVVSGASIAAGSIDVSTGDDHARASRGFPGNRTPATETTNISLVVRPDFGFQHEPLSATKLGMILPGCKGESV